MKSHRTPLALVLATSCAASNGVRVPDALKVPPGQTLALEAHAIGVQVYGCEPSPADPARFEWRLKGPKADLYDNVGKSIGKHYEGPTWESIDGSKVVGEVRVKAPGPDATAIPWLLLAAKSTEGTGVLARTASIQRLNTVAGLAPETGCTPDQSGKEIRIGYQATYHFYRER